MTQVKLSTAMHCVLVRIASAGVDGLDTPLNDRGTLAALKRRDLVEYRGSRATPRLERWHVSADGRAWLAAEEARRRAR